MLLNIPYLTPTVCVLSGLQQTNEILANKNGRLIFSKIDNCSNAEKELRRESASNKYNSPTSSRRGPKPEAWFLPVTPRLEQPHRQPFKERAQNFGSPIKPLISQPVNSARTILKRPSSYSQQMANNEEENNSKKKNPNVSLQQAFETHKQDLIDRSVRRQNVIQSRAQQR